MTIRQQGGIFGRNPTFNDVTVDGTLTVNGEPISDFGTMAQQDADNVNIDGGTIDGTDVTVGSGKTLNVSAGTFTVGNNQISGDAVDGGTISNFASTGIDDNAASSSWTVSSGGDLLPVNTGAQDFGSAANGLGDIIQHPDGRREIGNSTSNKMIEFYGRKFVNTSTVDMITFPSGAGFGSANYTAYLSGELEVNFWGYNSGYSPIFSKKKYHISVEKFQTNNLGMNIAEIVDWSQNDGGVTINPTFSQKAGASATSTTLEFSATVSSGTILRLDVQFFFRALTQGTNPSLSWIGAEVAP